MDNKKWFILLTEDEFTSGRADEAYVCPGFPGQGRIINAVGCGESSARLTEYQIEHIETEIRKVIKEAKKYGAITQENFLKAFSLKPEQIYFWRIFSMQNSNCHDCGKIKIDETLRVYVDLRYGGKLDIHICADCLRKRLEERDGKMA